LSKARCLIIFVNQIRSKVGVIFGSPEVTSGGNALRFYASVRLEVRRGQVIKHDGEASGTTCRVKVGGWGWKDGSRDIPPNSSSNVPLSSQVAKNKLAPPFRTAEFDILYGSGVDREGELLDLSVEAGLVRRSGAWYSTAIGCPSLGEEYKLGQGREKARAYLKQNPTVARELEQQTM
jgi:recombination protein RecA